MLVHKIALFAIVFASLAPSISHALEASKGASFVQEICTANGEKITIQVVTTQGQQLAMELSTKPANDKQTSGIQHHLQHCPFCASHALAAALPTDQLEIIALLEVTAQKAAKYATPVVVSRTYDSPPSQAPPSL